MFLSVARETWIEILKPKPLLLAADPQAYCSLAQLVHQIYVADFQQAERARVARKAATIIHHARFLFFHVDDHVAAFESRHSFTGWFSANDHLPVRVGQIQLPFAFGDKIGAQNVSLIERYHARDGISLGALRFGVAGYAINNDPVDVDLITLVHDRINQPHL